eukprot:7383238-Prymnesium_polylepis.1
MVTPRTSCGHGSTNSEGVGATRRAARARALRVTRECPLRAAGAQRDQRVGRATCGTAEAGDHVPLEARGGRCRADAP